MRLTLSTDLSDMFHHRIELPSAEARARLIGKDGAKAMDIEKVSGARLQITMKEVWIAGKSKVSTDLARRLVDKSIQHGLAANKVLSKQAELVDVIKSDLLMAAHFTYRD